MKGERGFIGRGEGGGLFIRGRRHIKLRLIIIFNYYAEHTLHNGEVALILTTENRQNKMCKVF